MKKGQQNKKVLVFGSFDGIHPGHLFFLNEAKKIGDLYISVASNESVKYRKWKDPKFDVSKRIEDIKKLNLAKEVIMGDKTPTTWTPIKQVMPDIIAIGYDQDNLEEVLKTPQKKYGFEIVRIKGYRENEFHSSIINEKINNMIKVIYFDFFGVLSTPAYMQAINLFVPEILHETYVSKLDLLDSGDLSEEQLVNEISDISNTEKEVIWSKIDSLPKLNLELIEYINTHLKSKYRIGLLTNIPKTLLDRLFSSYINNFEIKIISSEVKLIKPNKEIFDLAINLSQVRPEEILFIDDSIKNIEQSSKMNMRTIHYKNFEDFKSQIDSILNS